MLAIQYCQQIDVHQDFVLSHCTMGGMGQVWDVPGREEGDS